MRLREKFEVGQIVYDRLGDYKAVVLSIGKNYLLLSRLERPDVNYSQVPRYVDA